MSIISALTKIKGNKFEKVEKYLPEIMLGTGIVLEGAAVVSAFFAKTKIDQILEEKEEKLEEIKETLDEEDSDYTEKDAKSDTKKINVQSATKVVASCIPTTLLFAGGTSLVVGAFVKERKRYIVAMGLAMSLDQTLKAYRKRVIDEEGEEKDRHYMYGTEVRDEIHTEVDEDGKKVKRKDKVEEISGEVPGLSPYSFIWGERFQNGRKNDHWDTNMNYNLSFLRIQEAIANDILDRRGHIFLNEVLDSIGMEHTPIGAIVGWVKGNGDGVVDFGLVNNERESIKQMYQNEPVFVLDFNVDGPIYNLI